MIEDDFIVQIIQAYTVDYGDAAEVSVSNITSSTTSEEEAKDFVAALNILSKNDNIRKNLESVGWINTTDNRDLKLELDDNVFLMSSGFGHIHPINPAKLSASDAEKLATDKFVNIFQTVTIESLLEVMPEESKKKYLKAKKDKEEKAKKAKLKREQTAKAKKEKELEKARQLLKENGELE